MSPPPKRLPSTGAFSESYDPGVITRSRLEDVILQGIHIARPIWILPLRLILARSRFYAKSRFGQGATEAIILLRRKIADWCAAGRALQPAQKFQACFQAGGREAPWRRAVHRLGQRIDPIMQRACRFEIVPFHR